MLVTDIKPVTKQKFQIEIDGQPAFVVYKGCLLYTSFSEFVI